MRRLLLAVGVGLLASPGLAEDDEPRFGDPNRVLFWNAEEKAAGFPHYDKVFASNEIPAGGTVLALPTALRDLGTIAVNEGLTLDDYATKGNIAGLIVVQNGSVVYERYGMNANPATRWVSFSVAKSVTSMLIGAAIEDGYIAGLDSTVSDHLPQMAGTAYADVTLDDLMRMSSGVAWNEDYTDPNSDIQIPDWSTDFVLDYLAAKPRTAEPGTLFNYNTAETNLAGAVLRAAIGRDLASYLSEKIWRPFGMESDATWRLTAAGDMEFGGCCISATLRDYARLGLFALSGGRLSDGTSVLPDGWMEQSLRPSATSSDYGLFWWLPKYGGFLASGIFGQRIYVNPELNLVIAQLAARENASSKEDRQLQAAMETAVVEALRD